jgi:hypothetical protein
MEFVIAGPPWILECLIMWGVPTFTGRTCFDCGGFPVLQPDPDRRFLWECSFPEYCIKCWIAFWAKREQDCELAMYDVFWPEASFYSCRTRRRWELNKLPPIALPSLIRVSLPPWSTEPLVNPGSCMYTPTPCIQILLGEGEGPPIDEVEGAPAPQQAHSTG